MCSHTFSLRTTFLLVCRSVGGYLAQKEPHTKLQSQQKFSPDTRVMGHSFLSSTAKCPAKWWSGKLTVANIRGIENRICCCYCKLFNSGCAVALHQIPDPRRYWVVFPIRVTILKPGFRVAEKRNPGKHVFFRVLKWMRFWAIKIQYHWEITTVGPCAIYQRIVK